MASAKKIESVELTLSPREVQLLCALLANVVDIDPLFPEVGHMYSSLSGVAPAYEGHVKVVEASTGLRVTVGFADV